MAKKYLDDTGMSYFWGKLKAYFQVKLVSGTNIKTINNVSILGSGNISTTDDSGWIELVSLCKYRKKNGIVTVRINASIALTTDWVTKGTLPDGYRPSEVIYQPGYSLGSGSVNIAFLITTGGAIQARLNSGATSATITTGTTITYPV